MKHLLKLTVGIMIVAGHFAAQAQFGAPGGLPQGFHHALLDVLADGPSFYGKAQIQLSNGPGKDPSILSCKIAISSGNMRLEVDSFGAGLNLSPTEVARIKQMHLISILRPDKNRTYMVFPALTSFLELAYCNSTGTNAAPALKISKNPLGKESVGDQACDKSQWKVTESSGEYHDITVWTSMNVSNLPIQIKVGAPPVWVIFQNLHLEAPASSLFEVPAGYIKYEGIQENILRDAEKRQITNSP